MKKPLVSILIPVFNRDVLLKHTLDSILKQTYTNWECILVDDGSTDASVSVMHQYAIKDPRFKIFERPYNLIKGANSCRNFAFEKAQGEFVNWFDSDDILHPNFIEYKVNAFKNDIDVVISKTQFFSKNINQIEGKESRTRMSDTILEDFITLEVSWYLPDPMWRRSFLIGKKLFSETLLKGQDRDFHIRRLIEQPTVAVIDEYLTYYRQHEASISNDFSANVATSMFEATNERIMLVTALGLSSTLKFFFLKQQSKLYPYVYKERGSFIKHVKVFKKLFVFNAKNIIWFCKFMVCALSLYITGKGSSILKG